MMRPLKWGGVAKWLRQRSAKPLFTGSTPVAASIPAYKRLVHVDQPFFCSLQMIS